MAELTHLDSKGRAHMVDVSTKDISVRHATAKGSVRMQPETLRLIQQGSTPKGDVLAAARLAGIMGAKRTADLVPLCHPLPIESVAVELDCNETDNAVEITAHCKTTGRTGIEMEALTAVTVAALTIYDMCKAVDRGMVISEIRLTHKRGGRSGTYSAD